MAGAIGGNIHAVAQQTGGRPFVVQFKNGQQRCAHVVQDQRFRGGLALRFVCSGYCQLPTKHPSDQCRTVDTGAGFTPPGVGPGAMLPAPMPPARRRGAMMPARTPTGFY